MTQAAEQVLQSALALPDAEQVELVEALIAELDRREARPFGDEWLAEVESRETEYEAGRTTATPWSVVKDRVRKPETGRG